MIAALKTSQPEALHGPQRMQFEALLPRIEAQLRHGFRRLTPEARDEAVQEGVANCYRAYLRLHEQGRGERAFPSSLARYAIRHVRAGRKIGGRLNVRDPLSRYAQLRKGIQVQRLQRFQRESGRWVDAMVADRRAPIPDQVALRIDVPVWLNTLSRRARAIAEDLALGDSTAEVAKKHRVSAGRISQRRRELFDSWQRFQETSAAPCPSRT